MCPAATTDFQRSQRTFLGTTRTLYSLGDRGAVVVILHDIPGITPAVLQLGRLLAGQGFRIALPSLFGMTDVAPSRSVNLLAATQINASPEFLSRSTDGSRRIVNWLRELCGELSAETGMPIGVIGLGVTGEFALSLTVGTDAMVVAPVMCAPTIPTFSVERATTGLTPVEQENLRARAPACLALRFTSDAQCPAARFDSYARIVGEHFVRLPITSPQESNKIGTAAHSPLTEDFQDTPGHPTRKAFEEVCRFLHEALDEKQPVHCVDVRPLDRLSCFGEVLRHEMKVILKADLPPRGSLSEQAYARQTQEAVDQLKPDLAALCLSGGGIRSATFALGVLQGLARLRLLGQFHYLSSVSGGGYIASWLSAWREQESDDTVFPALNRSMRTGEEPTQITGIRKDSNYLTPQLGLLSADTWTVVALYIRNLVLNWVIFGPFFLGCLMLPRFCAELLQYIKTKPWDPESTFAVFRFGGIVLLLIGLIFGIYGRFRKSENWLKDRLFQWLVLLPLVASGVCFTVVAVVLGSAREQGFAEDFAQHHLYRGALCGALIYAFAWLIGRGASYPQTDPSERQIEKRDVLYWALSGAVVGMLACTGMIVIASNFSTPDSRDVAEGTEIFGLSGFVLAYLIGELVYVGLASFARKGEMDREWLARSSGWLSATAVLWALFSAVALYGPEVLKMQWGKITSLGGLSGAITLALGSSKLTSATKALQSIKSVPIMRVASAAALLFALFIASLLSLLNEQLERSLTSSCAEHSCRIQADLEIMLVAIAFAAGASWFINVNRYSMHALYRNRLVRAFVGSARGADRNPDPFTRFDPKDDLHLSDVKPTQPGADGRLFHVINTTLNVVHTDNRAWQERKAESFTMSRLFCGNSYVGYRPTEFYGGSDKGGLSLGTAMAISGAAVSPSQGYNSSPLIGFLLMLFNVRLGWWLGSPKRSSYPLEGPTFSLTPALRELAGDTTDRSRWIYLSDGGHFDNLGLYEMVRRRCRHIVVSDAGCDPACSFEDLGNAVRKIFIDFGVSIEFDQLEIKPRQKPPAPGIRFAVGTIKYPGSDRPGWLLYLKPTYTATMERADVRSYASANPLFPHESTTDQWFSESQLEAYRALGASIAEYVCSGGEASTARKAPEPMDLSKLESTARSLLAREMAALQSKPAGGSRQTPPTEEDPK